MLKNKINRDRNETKKNFVLQNQLDLFDKWKNKEIKKKDLRHVKT